MRRGWVLLFALLVAGCASGSAIVTGTKRAPLTPEEVRVYSRAPDSSEVIGIVHGFSEAGFTSQQSTDFAVAELRRQAASIGANGVVLTGSGSAPGSVSGVYISNASGGGMFYGGGLGPPQSASGEAIYVAPKQ